MVEVHLGARFEKLVQELFEKEGFPVSEREVRPQDSLPYDFSVRSTTGKVAVVEIKLYRSQKISFPTILKVATKLEFVRTNFGADVGILVIGNKVGEFNSDQFKAYFPKIVLYDIDVVAFLAANHLELRTRLEEIIVEAAIFSDPVELTPARVSISDDLLTDGPSDASSAAPVLDQPMGAKEGTTICKELHAVAKGKSGAKRFEDAVERALRYIFATDLSSWSRQASTNDRVSIFDLIARISSKHDFWTAIVNQFNSRYIVFEFKNYSAKIAQGQIYTTEKYLYKTALRSTAIIISRDGADKNALIAARGALREHGKLIINLNVEQLCRMLKLRESDDDYNEVLVEVVDDMLMRLDR